MKILVILLLASVTVVALQSIPQANAPAVLLIDKCTHITKTGDYELSRDISGANAPDACIILDADDIALDCKGFSVTETPNAAGIKIAADRVSLIKCMVTNNNKGIFIGGKNNYLDRNFAYNNRGYGFYIEGNSNFLVMNEANENEGNGFEFKHKSTNFVTHNSLLWNAAIKNKKNGFQIEGQTNSLTDNFAKENEEHGFIDKWEGGSMNSFFENHARSNKKSGFFLEDNGGYEDNFAEKNLEAGFFIDKMADRVYLDSNEIVDNGGMSIDQGNIVVTFGFDGELELINNRVSGGCNLLQESSFGKISLNNNNFCDAFPKTCTDGRKISCFAGKVNDQGGNKFASSEQTSCADLVPVTTCGMPPMNGTQPQK